MKIKLVNHPLLNDPNFDQELANSIYNYVDSNYGTTWVILQNVFAASGNYTSVQVTKSLRYLEKTNQVSTCEKNSEISTPNSIKNKLSPEEEKIRLRETIKRALARLNDKSKNTKQDSNETN